MGHTKLRVVDLVQHAVETRVSKAEAIEADVRQCVVPRHRRLGADAKKHAVAPGVRYEFSSYITQPPSDLGMRIGRRSRKEEEPRLRDHFLGSDRIRGLLRICESSWRETLDRVLRNIKGVAQPS